MLEYLLLRPLDMDLFATGEDSKWRFIVVDEAHVYDGSQGAEIAMLLRRVRDRVAPKRSLRCIATSATVGSDPGAVTKFATALFGQAFEWVAHDPSRQDLILATRVEAPTGPFWGPLGASDYVALFEAGVSSDPERLSHEQSLATLRKVLGAGPTPFDDAARAVFGQDPNAGVGLAAMVAVASAAKFPDGTPPLSARYHLFLRATEGAFTCLSRIRAHTSSSPAHETCPDCTRRSSRSARASAAVLSTSWAPPHPRVGSLRLRPRKAGSKGTWLVLSEASRPH